MTKKAFTLVEILVVVLIIGILTAVAIPMYQSAVDKSRWSTLLLPARTIKSAQEAHHMATNSYAYVPDELDVGFPPENASVSYTLETKKDSQSTLIGESSALPNVRLSWMLKEQDDFLFCDAKTGDSRATRLCEKLLGGTKASTKDGYTKYLLDYPGPCAWANSTGQCYVSEEARCTALGMPYANGVCGYVNQSVSSSTQINEGGVCKTTNGGCRDVQVNEGGVCEASGYNGCLGAKIHDGGICEATDPNTWGCGQTTIDKGGVCIGLNSYSCQNITVDGGKCIAKGAGACGTTLGIAGRESTYKNGGCCEDYGKGYCPSYAPKCSD